MMDTFCSWWLTIISLSWVYLSIAKSTSSQHQWKLDRVECRSSICVPMTCNVVPKSRTIQVLNADCHLTGPVSSVHARLTLFYRFNYYRPFLLDASANVCDYLGPQKTNQPIMNVFGSFLLSKSNFNHSCPLSGDLWIKGFKLNSNALAGVLLPKGQYRADVRAYENPSTPNRTIFELETYFTVSNGKSDVDMEMG